LIETKTLSQVAHLCNLEVLPLEQGPANAAERRFAVTKIIACQNRSSLQIFIFGSCGIWVV